MADLLNDYDGIPDTNKPKDGSGDLPAYMNSMIKKNINVDTEAASELAPSPESMNDDWVPVKKKIGRPRKNPLPEEKVSVNEKVDPELSSDPQMDEQVSNKVEVHEEVDDTTRNYYDITNDNRPTTCSPTNEEYMTTTLGHEIPDFDPEYADNSSTVVPPTPDYDDGPTHPPCDEPTETTKDTNADGRTDDEKVGDLIKTIYESMQEILEISPDFPDGIIVSFDRIKHEDDSDDSDDDDSNDDDDDKDGDVDEDDDDLDDEWDYDHESCPFARIRPTDDMPLDDPFVAKLDTVYQPPIIIHDAHIPVSYIKHLVKKEVKHWIKKHSKKNKKK